MCNSSTTYSDTGSKNPATHFEHADLRKPSTGKRKTKCDGMMSVLQIAVVEHPGGHHRA